MKILALTFGDSAMASTQYRLVQFEQRLRADGIVLERRPAAGFSDWPALRAYDLVIVQKKLLRLSAVRKARRNAKLLVYDTDDAVWEPHGRKHFWWTRLRTGMRIRAISKAADLCTAANENLAGALRVWNKRVEVVPMALDGATWFPAATRSSGPVRIGWTGAPPNLAYLKGIGHALAEVQRLRPAVELIVYSGASPEWEVPVSVRHVPFEPGTEPDVVRSFDIGLLPLPDNPFAAGKSPIKALQYAACGIPCVASPVGATTEIVRDGETGLLARNNGEWLNALCRLIDDVAERRRLGDNARRLFLERHEQAAVARRLVEALCSAGRSRRV